MACWSAKMLDFMKNEVSKWIGAISLEESKKNHWESQLWVTALWRNLTLLMTQLCYKISKHMVPLIMSNFHPDTKLWYLGPGCLGYFRFLCMAKNSSGKSFLTALACVKSRVRGRVNHQHKFKVGAAVVPRFLLLLLRLSWVFFASTDIVSAPPSNELLQKDMIKRSNHHFLELASEISLYAITWVSGLSQGKGWGCTFGEPVPWQSQYIAH